MNSYELENALEIVKIVILISGGLYFAARIYRTGGVQLIPHVQAGVCITWLCLVVSSIADGFDWVSFGPEPSGPPSPLQVLAEDGLAIVGYLMITIILVRVVPEVRKLEATAGVLQQFEQALVQRERREMVLHRELEDLYQLDHSDAKASVATILERTAKVLETARAGIWIKSEDGRCLVCVDIFDADANTHGSGEILMEEDYPVYFKTIQIQRVIRAVDAASDARTQEFKENYLAATGVKSMCDVRIEVPDVLSGMICIEERHRVRNWSHEEVSFIRAVGDLLIHKFARDEILASNQELERTRAKFETIANQTFNWEVWVDGKGKPQWTNPAVERVIGYSVNEILGCDDLPGLLGVDADSVARLESIVASAVRAESGDGEEVVLRRKDGEIIWGSFAWHPVREDVIGMSGSRLSIRDITARKNAQFSFAKAEAERRAADRQLHAFIENTPTAVLQVGPDLSVLAWNASATRIFGYAAEEALGQDACMLLPEARRASVRQEVIDMFARGGDIGPRVDTNLRKDGSPVMCRWYNTIVPGESGQEPRLFSMAADISEDVRNRQIVELERQRFKDFSMSASDFFWELDADGRVSYISERLFELSKVGPDDLVGRLVSEMPSFDDTDTGWLQLAEATSKRDMFRDLVISIAGQYGNRLRFAINGVPFYDADGAFVGFRGCGRDVTAEFHQRFVEQIIYVNLRGLIGENFFSALVKNMSEVFDFDWTYLGEIDPQNSERMNVVAAYGPDGEIVPFSFALPDSAAEAVIQDGALILGQGAMAKFPLDSQVQRYGISGYGGIRLTDEAGHPLGVLAFMSPGGLDDEGAVRSALEVFGPRAGAELARKRSELANEALQRQLLHSQRMETVGELAGGIAHDFNNILTPIMGYAEMLVEDMEDDKDTQRDAIAILNGAKRAKLLVQQILDFSKRTDNLDTGAVEVNGLVNQVVAFIAATMPGNIALSAEVLDEPRWVNGDPTKLDQVLINLITNAWHAIGAANGKITVHVETTDIDEATARMTPPLKTGPAVLIRVKDTGSGIPKDIIENIFEPFFTTKGSGKGTGFGLSTVRGIVEALEGVVTVSSRMGEGAEFVVTLPAVAHNETGPSGDHDVSQSNFALASRLKSGRLSILYVDDEIANNKVVSRMLQKAGHAVSAFHDPRDALAHFLRDPYYYDLVITDDSMPELPGHELCAKLIDKNAYLPIIVVTGGEMGSLVDRYSALGVTTFVSKPFRASDISEAIDKASTRSMSRIMESL